MRQSYFQARAGRTPPGVSDKTSQSIKTLYSSINQKLEQQTFFEQNSIHFE